MIRAATACVLVGALVACDARSSRVPKSAGVDAERSTASWQGWSGGLELEDGGRVEVDLARLHAERERQEADARAWRRSLALEPGEPFALDVACSSDATSSIDLSALRVVDRDGAALAPISSQVGGPVAVLASPPRAPLAPGERIRLLVWGRAPGDGARVQLGTGRSIELASSVREGVRASSALARVPAGTGDAEEESR